METLFDWIFRYVLTPGFWFAFIYFLARLVVLGFQFSDTLRNRRLVNIEPTIDSIGVVEVLVENRSTSEIAVSRIELVRDKSIWSHILRKYLIGVDRFASMDSLLWGPSSITKQRIGPGDGASWYFEVDSSHSEGDRKKSFFRPLMVRTHAGGFRILSNVDFLEGIIATPEEAVVYQTAAALAKRLANKKK